MRVGQSGCALAASLVLLLGAGCFERGGKKAREGSEHGRDGGAPARVVATGEAPEPAGTPDPDAVIAIRLEAEPAHLNPLLAGDAIAARVALGDIYEGLLCTDRPGAAPHECLAEAVEVDDARTTWRFTLRRGVAWHDGRPFATEDVLFTFDVVRGGHGDISWLASDFDDLTGIEAVGERVVEMRFAGFRPGRREAFARVPILPKHVFRGQAAELLTHSANRRPVGTGPLRFVGWKAGESITLERFAGYWGTAARAKRIEYRVLPNRQQTASALASGKLDLALQLPIEEARDLARGHRDLILFGYQRPAYLAAVYNLRRPMLGDVRTRRALTMLLDRSAIADKLFGNHARVITGPFLPGGPDEDPSIEPLAFAPDRAAKLLAQAARAALAAGSKTPAPNETPKAPFVELTMLAPAGSRTMARIADIWAEDARPYARLKVEPIAYADLLARVREGRFDVALMAFTTARDLDLYTRFHSAEVGGENYGALVDPELDRPLEAVRREPDAAKRALLQHRVHQRVHQLQPYTFIVSDSRVGLVRRGVGGVRAGGGFSARFLWRERAT